MRLAGNALLIPFFLICLFFTPVSFAAHYSKVQVEIEGLSPMATPLVESGLSIKAASEEKKLHADRIESLHQIAPTEITTTLEALGYYNSQIESSLLKKDSLYLAHYQVEMGPPTIIQSIHIEIRGVGKNHPELQAIACSSPLKIGEQATHYQYEDTKQKLLGKALQLGFLDARFEENEIQINRDNDTAKIILILDTGPQYRIGDVSFIENIYPPEYVRRYVPFRYGVPYTTEELISLQRSLTETDLFRYVRIDPNLKEAKNYVVPLNITLKPKPKNRYTGSLGYGTDTGARGMFFWEHRRHSHPGHRINAEVQVAKWKKFGNLRYTIPGENPSTDRQVFAFRNTEERFRDAKYSFRSDVGAVQIKKLGPFERMLGLHYLILERYRELPGFPKKNAHYFIPNGGLVYTDIFQKTPTQEGYRLSFALRGAARDLASTTSFAQSELRFKWVTPIPFIPKTRLLVRSEVGATAVKHRDKISLSLRYFTGGDQTIRGYGYKSLGPRKKDAYGNEIVVGGQYLAVGSIELEQKIYKEFSGAIFFDVGQAMNKWRTRFGRSIGLGVRYATPLGPLRVDVAQALRPITEQKARPRIHFTFGMDL